MTWRLSHSDCQQFGLDKPGVQHCDKGPASSPMRANRSPLAAKKLETSKDLGEVGCGLIYSGVGRQGRVGWRGRSGMFDVEGRLAGRSRKGDDLVRLAAVVDFELFRPELKRAVPRADRSKGGRPPFDHVLMFKLLVLQTQNNLSDERTDF